MIRKIITYIILPLVIVSSIWNAYYSIISFIASNLSIRESFSFTNDVYQKGTHWGGDNYRLTARKYKLDFVKLNFSDIISSFSRVSNIDPLKSNFNKEYQLISLLYDLEKKSNAYKRESLLYIPKTLDYYWDLSCDTHMPPFVAPAITNIAMIEGLPMRDSSCYTHFLDYGYYTYDLLGIKPEYITMTHDQICDRAKLEGLFRVIEITENDEGGIVTITHECVD